MTKADRVVHAIRTFRNFDDVGLLLAWDVDKTRRARYTGTEWLKSLVGDGLLLGVVQRSDPVGSRVSNMMTTQEHDSSWFGLCLGPAHLASLSLIQRRSDRETNH